MNKEVARVLLELFPNWTPTGEEKRLWSENMRAFSDQTAIKAIRAYKNTEQYPTPNPAKALAIANEISRSDTTSRVPLGYRVFYWESRPGYPRPVATGTRFMPLDDARRFAASLPAVSDTSRRPYITDTNGGRHDV